MALLQPPPPPPVPVQYLAATGAAAWLTPPPPPASLLAAPVELSQPAADEATLVLAQAPDGEAASAASALLALLMLAVVAIAIANVAYHWRDAIDRGARATLTDAQYATLQVRLEQLRAVTAGIRATFDDVNHVLRGTDAKADGGRVAFSRVACSTSAEDEGGMDDGGGTTARSPDAAERHDEQLSPAEEDGDDADDSSPFERIDVEAAAPFAEQQSSARSEAKAAEADASSAGQVRGRAEQREASERR